MDARERVRQALAGEAVDRPPFCLWHHFRPEGSPAALADATVAFFGDLDLDLYKVMPDLPYPGPTARPLAASADWRALPALSAASGGPLASMAAAVALVRRQRPQAVVLATVFSPLALAIGWSGGAAGVREAYARDPEAVLQGLGVVADNVAGQCAACLAAGADGIFFATNGLGDGMFSAEAYRTLGRAFDLRAMEGCDGGWCNVLHLHAAAELNWAWARDYPAHVFSWSDRRTGVPLRTIAEALPDRAVMGGIDEFGAIVRGDAAAVLSEMDDSVRQTGGRRLILAGGCSVPDDIAPEHLRTARSLAGNLRLA